MADAASPFLNQPLRSEQDARAACDQAEQERRRRLEQHGVGFARAILAGAFERVYQADGSYRLRDIETGVWLEELPPVKPISESTRLDVAPKAQAADDPLQHGSITAAARRSGYGAALRDVARWISTAAVEPHMHPATLAALNAKIADLARHAQRTPPVADS